VFRVNVRDLKFYSTLTYIEVLGRSAQTKTFEAQAIAIKKAIESPMCEATIKGATEVLFLVRGNVMIKDTEVVRDYIIDLVGYDVQVLYNIMVDESMGDTLSVTLIAMGMKA
jgi:cell division GTPase FtsZ